MKNLKYLMLATVATPALATDPAALKQYQVLEQAYYEYDTHAYESFTCHVDASSLDATVANTRQMLASHTDTLQMKDELSSYSVTVAGNVLSIDNPTLDIQILSDKGMADPAKVRLGIEQMKQGFTTQAQGIDQIISGVFNAYLGTVPDLTSVTRDGNKWVVKYVEGGVAATDTIDGPKVHEVASANGLSVITDSAFTKLSGDKLGLHASAIQIQQGPQTAVTSMTVSYQKLGPLQVPASIVTKTTVTTPGVGQTTMDNTISFQACTIKT